jgi:hypothetical protein
VQGIKNLQKLPKKFINLALTLFKLLPLLLCSGSLLSSVSLRFLQLLVYLLMHTVSLSYKFTMSIKKQADKKIGNYYMNKKLACESQPRHYLPLVKLGTPFSSFLHQHLVHVLAFPCRLHLILITTQVFRLLLLLLT